MLPPRPVYSTHSNNSPQDHLQQNQQQLELLQQFQFQKQLPGNPQYHPPDQLKDFSYTSAPTRGPQGAGELVAPVTSIPLYRNSNQELQEQIRLMQEELNRRQTGA
jgi:hypothetical protein